MNNGAGRTNLATCEQIQPVLFDYLARELGTAQSDVVREHLRQCESCRRSAAELQHTVKLLRASDRAAGAPVQLSSKRRQRLLWAIMHPVLDWIYGHHLLVSFIVGVLLAVALAFGLMRGKPLWKPADVEGVGVTLAPPEAPFTVELGPTGSSADVTALVRESAERMLQEELTNAPAAPLPAQE